MIYGEPVKPETQPINTGMLVRVLKAVPDITNTTNTLQPYGLSPMTGRPLVGKNVNVVMGFEGGSGISITNATEKYGKKGTLLRRGIRIDKKPWPNGETDIRLRITIKHGQTIGNNGTSAPDKTIIEPWSRNTAFDKTYTSNEAPTNDFLTSNGFGASTASIRVRLEPRGVGPGQPLVWQDENPLSETFTRCFWSDPVFSHGVTYVTPEDDDGNPIELQFPLPNPQWIMHRINFSNGYVGVKYNDGNPLGVVMGITATIECVGWDTGYWDIDGWHAGTIDDPYLVMPGPTTVPPNSYEYPNYPISNPFNPTGPGVG